MPSSEGIRVAVRVRPFLPQEKGSASCVEVDVPSNQISIGRPPPKEDGPGEGKGKGRERGRGRGGEQQGHHQRHRPRRTFTFDHSPGRIGPRRGRCTRSASRPWSGPAWTGTMPLPWPTGRPGPGRPTPSWGPAPRPPPPRRRRCPRRWASSPAPWGSCSGSWSGPGPRAAEDPSSSSSFEYSVGLQFLELYGEDIRDLLAPAPQEGDQGPRGSPSGTPGDDCEVLGATSVPVGVGQGRPSSASPPGCSGGSREPPP